MYDYISNRLRGEAEVSKVPPYIKDLMREAADTIDALCIAVEKLSAPTIIPASDD